MTLGEVVADVYREEGGSSTGMPLVARPGGAPANVAVAAARLGVESSFVGVVGRELFGDFILRSLGAEGVDVSGVRRCEPPTRTSLAFVEITEPGDRSFTFYRSDPAADELLSPEDVPENLLDGASSLSFGSMPLLAEPARSAVQEAVRRAARRGVPVAFDVNLRIHLWKDVPAAREAILPLLGASRIVKLSDDELEPLFGTGNAEEAAEAVLGLGAALVFVTSGPRGAFYATKGFSGSVPAFRVRAVDPTGAGDAFFAAALCRLSGEGLEDRMSEPAVREAAVQGCAAGALAATGYGAIEALPAERDLRAFIRDAR